MLGLRDLLFKSTYALGHQITLKHIFVCDKGTKYYLKKSYIKLKKLEFILKIWNSQDLEVR